MQHQLNFKHRIKTDVKFVIFRIKEKTTLTPNLRPQTSQNINFYKYLNIYSTNIYKRLKIKFFTVNP